MDISVLFGCWVFFWKFKGTSSFKFHKFVFSCLLQNNGGLSISMGLPLQIAHSGSQSSESGNELAAIVSIAGISFPLHFKRISGMPISAISQQQEAAKNQRTGFQRGILENF
jgi:hypothetical protein